jgi:hypothetical protein
MSAHLVDNWAGSGVHDFRIYYFFSNLVDSSESDEYQESTLAVVPLRVPKEMLKNRQYDEALELLRTQVEAQGFTVYRNLHRNLPWDNWRYDDLEGRESRYPPVYVEANGAEAPVLVEQDGRLRCGQCGSPLGHLNVAK